MHPLESPKKRCGTCKYWQANSDTRPWHFPRDHGECLHQPVASIAVVGFDTEQTGKNEGANCKVWEEKGNG